MTQELIERLEPCPFCGAAAFIDSYTEDGTTEYRAKCSNCPMQSYWSIDPKRMAAAWNTRDQSQSARIAELLAVEADAVSGLRYIVARYGRLEGVGWDRVFDAHEALTKDSTSG